ncbi:MAG TPA: NAD-dependent epimerase/dehydratase family protein, partial [Gaiellales bacterium]
HQEHLATVFGRELGVPVVRLRYHNAYGPGMPRDTPYAGVASIFRSALERGESPRVFEDGGQMRDFVHVSDIAAANVLALSPDAPTGAFNIASGDPHSVGDMASVLARTIDPRLTPTVTGEFRAGDVRHVFASPARARDELGFAAEVRFGDGIAAFAREPLRGAPTASR